MIPISEYPVPSYLVHVTETPDVCVVGGGAAGLGAAVGAARAGMKTLLIEKCGFCGGATVAGLSGTICGLFSSGHRPEQIVFGFAGEFFNLLKWKHGAGNPVPFGRTMLVPHESLVWKEAADYLLSASAVRIMYHTHFLKAFDREGQVHTLLAQTKEGQIAIQPKVAIDASGDAEVVYSLGGETTFGKDGVVQTPTMMFRMGNVDMETFLKLDPQEVNQLVAKADKEGLYVLPRHHVYLFPMPNGHEVLCNMTRVSRPDSVRPLGLSSDDMTFAEMEGRAQARAYSSFLHDCVPGFSSAYVVETGAQVGIRQSRSIVGRERLMNNDVTSGRKVVGAASFSAWPIELHHSAGVRITYLENDFYDIPFETLVPRWGSNLLVAGRCLSAEHEALSSARVTAQCFGMGYAVGAAAGLIATEKISAQELTGGHVSQWMHEHRMKTAGER